MTILRRLDPCRFVLLTLPAILLILPDGIPFLRAACNSVGTVGQVTNVAVATCTSCLIGCGGPTTAVATVTECTVSGSSTKCELSATVSFQIFTSGCVLEWTPSCAGGVGNCTSAVEDAATGPFSGSDSKSFGCDSYSDAMVLDLNTQGTTCVNCTPVVLFRGTGSCDP